MCEPDEQDYFSDQRVDDPKIDDADRVLRHCCVPVQVVPCKVHGQKLSDQIFKRKKGDVGTSVDLECLLEHDGKTWEDRFGAKPGSLAMVAVAAADIRAVNGGVAWTPKPAQPELAPSAAAEANPYHGEIIGDLPRSSDRALSRKVVVLRQVF